MNPDPLSIHTGNVQTDGSDFVGSDKFTVIVNGQRLELPRCADLLAYVHLASRRLAKCTG